MFSGQTKGPFSATWLNIGYVSSFSASCLQQDEGEDSDVDGEDEVEEKITRNWSVLKTTPELRKSKVLSVLIHHVFCFVFT